ncbi:aldehyde dehydrogenase [Mycobacterium intracellulare]|uniref:aldehyde dehydrogenase n=1 Tax=Mycobacterium intracellulare TaxID=1767 RepID=UPI00355767B0
MEHLISARTRAQTVDKTAATLGVALPAKYVEQVAQTHAFADAAAQIAATADDLLTAVFAAIEDGRDYHSDPSVQRLALDHQLTSLNLGRTTERRVNEMLAAALTDWADDILDGWADALEPHSAALLAAAEAGLSPNSADAAAAKGVDAMRLLHDAQIAVKAWTDAVNGFYALAAVSGISYRGQGPLVLTSARRAVLEPAYEMARDARIDVDAWVLARCSIPLRLATIGEFMSRVAHYQADKAAEDRAREQRRVEAGFNR